MAPNTTRARFVHTNREKEEESSDDEPVEEEEEEDETDEEEEEDETTKVTTRSSSEKEEKIVKEKKKEPITISLKKVCKVSKTKFILYFLLPSPIFYWSILRNFNVDNRFQYLLRQRKHKIEF